MPETRFPFLQSLAGEIDKLYHETEEEAKALVQRDVNAVRTKKDDVMRLARMKLTNHREALDAISGDLDQAAAGLLGSNSGEKKNPT